MLHPRTRTPLLFVRAPCDKTKHTVHETQTGLICSIARKSRNKEDQHGGRYLAAQAAIHLRSVIMYLRARVQSSRLLPNATGSPPMVPSCSLMSYGRRRVGSCSRTCSPTSPADVSTMYVAKTNRERRFNQDAKTKSDVLITLYRKTERHVSITLQKTTEGDVLFTLQKQTENDPSITLQNKNRKRGFTHVSKANRKRILLTLQSKTESDVAITLQNEIVRTVPITL